MKNARGIRVELARHGLAPLEKIDQPTRGSFYEAQRFFSVSSLLRGVPLFLGCHRSGRNRENTTEMGEHGGWNGQIIVVRVTGYLFLERSLLVALLGVG
jgi:hypothetical protein